MVLPPEQVSIRVLARCHPLYSGGTPALQKRAHNGAVDDPHFIAGLLRPFFWLLMAGVLAAILWAVRRLAPRLEKLLFRKL